MTGIGDDVFFLTMDEVVALLSGDRQSFSSVPGRRTIYRRYCALPPYPAIIYGRFDPFKWAADPDRRSDFYDARQTVAAIPSATIKGLAGAAGCVEGPVRRLDRVEDGCQVQPGEILVTSTTNIGWTPLFPRLAAIVTDVGAPLSHAAIVARELGIPAVVGCGNATSAAQNRRSSPRGWWTRNRGSSVQVMAHEPSGDLTIGHYEVDTPIARTSGDLIASMTIDLAYDFGMARLFVQLCCGAPGTTCLIRGVNFVLLARVRR